MVIYNQHLSDFLNCIDNQYMKHTQFIIYQHDELKMSPIGAHDNVAMCNKIVLNNNVRSPCINNNNLDNDNQNFIQIKLA